MGVRPDGGPTSWAADLITPDRAQSYREFAIEFQDLQLAYTDQSVHHPAPYPCAKGQQQSAAKTCPDGARHVAFKISIVTAAHALPDHTLTYNLRTAASGAPGPITQPDAILYVPSNNLDAGGQLKPGTPVEPLILRAAAGDCIDVTLTNVLDSAEKEINNLPVFNNPNPDVYPPTGMPPIPIYPSARAGLHAQQLEADITSSDGTRVGANPDQTAAPRGGTVPYSTTGPSRSSFASAKHRIFPAPGRTPHWRRSAQTTCQPTSSPGIRKRRYSQPPRACLCGSASSIRAARSR
jgi:hypothetical protein